MKLLRDFFRLRTAGRFPLSGRRAVAPRVPFTVTVPQPLNKPAERAPLDMHWQADAGQGRPRSHWHEHASTDGLGVSRHLQLVSSH